MSGKVAVVTGGIGGIGTEICRALSQAGYRVVACDTPIIAEQFAGWRQERQAEGMDIAVYGVDVSSFDSCREALQQITTEVGPVEILVNAAGITRDTTLKKMSIDQWRAVLSVNLDSVFNMTRNVIDGMLERGYGRVVNISSINGAKGQLGQTNYSAAKAGMHGFTMALAQEVARKGITVNTVSPGYIATKMVMAVPEDIRNKIIAQIPVNRLGKPEEIARLIVFLADEQTGYMTGANLHINGGQFMEH